MSDTTERKKNGTENHRNLIPRENPEKRAPLSPTLIYHRINRSTCQYFVTSLLAGPCTGSYYLLP